LHLLVKAIHPGSRYKRVKTLKQLTSHRTPRALKPGHSNEGIYIKPVFICA
jgi:hypothetical protein